MLSEQSDGCLLCQANVHHVGPIVILMAHQVCQLNITMQCVQFISTVEVIGLSVIQITIASLLASQRRGATFTVGVDVLSVIQGDQRLRLVWLPQKWSESRITGVVS